jgi:hypothetical protein
MTEAPLDVLDLFRIDAALSHGDLWLRYFELGGMSTGLQVEAYLYGALQPTRHDHDIIAHALNERFVELGGNHPVPYAEDAIPGAAHSGDAASEEAEGGDAVDDQDDPVAN